MKVKYWKYIVKPWKTYCISIATRYLINFTFYWVFAVFMSCIALWLLTFTVTNAPLRPVYLKKWLWKYNRRHAWVAWLFTLASMYSLWGYMHIVFRWVTALIQSLTSYLINANAQLSLIYYFQTLLCDTKFTSTNCKYFVYTL